MVFISGEKGNKGQILRGTKTILGNREHKKTNFRFLGNRGTSQFISGEQGNRYPPPPWEGLFTKNALTNFIFGSQTHPEIEAARKPVM